MWEYTFLRWIVENLQNPIFDWFFKFITTLGEMAAIYFLISIIMVFFKKTRKAGIISLIGLVFIACSNHFIFKPLIQRPRPFLSESTFVDAIFLKDYMTSFSHQSAFNAWLVPDSYSFMSGHTLSAFLFAFTVSYYHRKWSAPVLITSALMAFSRLYFAFHYPTDILMGLVTAAVASALLIVLEKRFGEKIVIFCKSKYEVFRNKKAKVEQ